jgi:hypothetical protein
MPAVKSNGRRADANRSASLRGSQRWYSASNRIPIAAMIKTPATMISVRLIIRRRDLGYLLN